MHMKTKRTIFDGSFVFYQGPYQNPSLPVVVSMSTHLSLLKSQASNPKVLGAVVVIGVTLTGIVVFAEVRRRRKRLFGFDRADFGAFVERFELLPCPQPPPPAAKQPLSGLTFAVNDIFHVKGHVTGFGSPDWATTHQNEDKTAVVILALLKSGAACVGKTVIDELGSGVSGENMHYGTPKNPRMPKNVPGGASSGSAAAVSAELVDFAVGIDTLGCIRIPAAFCGILGFRASHGSVSSSGVIPNSPSLDSVGWFAREPTVLHSIGDVLLQPRAVEPKRERRLVFADDLFQLTKIPKQKAEHVIAKVIESLSGYQISKHINIGQYIASEVPSLQDVFEDSKKIQNGIIALNALSYVMVSLQRYEFKIKHEEWIKSVNTKFPQAFFSHIPTFAQNFNKSVKVLYKVKTEMQTALQSLLKDDKILAFPTVADPPPKLGSKRRCVESWERALILSSIVSLSGCCQVAIPMGKHNGVPISISFATFHGGDKFLLDTVLDIFSPLQEQAALASNLSPMPDLTGDMDAAELLKEKGNSSFKSKQFNKAISYYSEAIKLNGTMATYYCNRAAAYLELGCFQQAEDDCSKAILLDKKNVKAFLRRGTARESLLCYKEASQDFKHALVLEPQNKAAGIAEKRLRKLLS